MGTFGTGPFDSDGALDLLDDLAARPADSRADVLAALLGRPIADPDSIGREVFADEVVAAVAVVASGLAGRRAGEPWWDEVAGKAAAVLPIPDLIRLVPAATAVLAIVAEPWGRDWTSPDDAVAAEETARRLAEVLSAAG
ncbi:DUF4259 domain-containing protein [Lentzea sp. NPDC092896]|uniref:DUF4259 domain-containing protein n=1 Tax=Lentzea sp. NPDC092896 TaxID=3364127 RepID=UPI003804FC71